MSRNFAVLNKATKTPPAAPLRESGQFHDLIRALFQKPTAVALVGIETDGVSQIAEALAAELSATGKRTLVVSVAPLLQMDPIVVPEEIDFAAGAAPNTWTWPACQKLEFFKPRETSGPGSWLDSLRRRFDFVLFDCLGVNEVAVMADAAVLTVEAGHTTKQQLRNDQQALRLRGAKLAGTILVQRS